MAEPTRTPENQILGRRRVEEHGDERSFPTPEETYASDVVINRSLSPERTVTGREASTATLQGLFDAVPATAPTTDDLVAEGDTVACRLGFAPIHDGEFMDVPLTGMTVSRQGVAVLRVEAGTARGLTVRPDAVCLMGPPGATESAGGP